MNEPTRIGPNFERLKDAYAIIDGIPEEAFDLDAIIKKKGESLGCGTIACAAGWIGLHPTFAKHLRPKKVREHHSLSWGFLEWNLDDRATFDYTGAMATLFDISRFAARQLFAPRYMSDYDSLICRQRPKTVVTHKELWKARVREFLKEHGQPIAEAA